MKNQHPDFSAGNLWYNIVLLDLPVDKVPGSFIAKSAVDAPTVGFIPQRAVDATVGIMEPPASGGVVKAVSSKARQFPNRMMKNVD